MSNDTPRTTIDPQTPAPGSSVPQKTSDILAEYMAAHKLGQHYLTPRIGCPSCVFGRGRKP